MKRATIFFLFPVLFNLFAMSAGSQSPIQHYEKQWKAVDELVKKNLPASALTEVKRIYIQAKKDKQDAQVIKSLVYMTSLQQENREDNSLLSIKEIENEIAGTKTPVAALLNSLLAGLYWNYFQSNRYLLYNRTNTTNFRKTDISTWTADDLHKKISDLYLASIRERKLLQQTRLEPFDAIIIKGNSRRLRPTLYDLLAHRALDYFKNDERDIKKPAYAFEINQAEVFAAAAVFARQSFPATDSGSLHYKALLIFQDLLGFHLAAKNTAALLEVDLERLEFARQYSVLPGKDELYARALHTITTGYTGETAVDQAWYQLALYYVNLGDQYQPHGDTSNRYARKKAREICEAVIKRKQETEGSVNCYNLLKQINAPQLSFVLEKVNIPAQPFRVLVSYRNLRQLHLRILQATDKLKDLLENRYDEKYWNSLVTATPLKQWQQSLPETGDLQTHSVELKVDALPPGEYILLAGTDANPGAGNTLAGARLFYVSGISYITSGNNFFVLGRDQGEPLADAAVQAWERRYDSKSSKYILEKSAAYRTDGNGFFTLRKTKTSGITQNYLLDITYKNERFFMNDLLYDYYAAPTPEEQVRITTNTYLFTDRGIYRPGQTIYFKGISVGKDSPAGKSMIRINYATTIYLKNANDEVVDSLSVKTNMFGSFSGKFQLPTAVLNGGFSLAMKNDEGSTGFQVEEYKRPKFYVDYKNITGTYKLNDSIRVTGQARAYAGNSISNAMVRYRVVREHRFLYPWLSRKYWLPPAPPMEITHGELKTDSEGNFDISFQAIPDLTIDKKLDPLFDYRIYADVTDLNGETRSGETSLSIGYKSLILRVGIPASLAADSLRLIDIRTENLAGQPVPAKVSVQVTKLTEEQRLIRNRYWNRPDQFVMSKEEYIRSFPNDEYDNESDYESWKRGAVVFQQSDSVAANRPFSLGKTKLQPGIYVIEISTQDKDGLEVKDLKYIELHDEKSNQLGRPQYLWTAGSKSIEPGEKTSVRIGSSASNLFVIQETDRPSAVKNGSPEAGSGAYDIFKIGNEKKSFLFSATEADRGGFAVSYLFVKNNRFFQFFESIQVPWTNKELKIEYATFRDKTVPGSAEKWKLRISGYNNEKPAAELLASLYDASLDQFYPFAWNKPYIWPYHYNNARWNGEQNFAEIISDQKAASFGVTKFFKKEYDRLMFPDFLELQYSPRTMAMRSMAVDGKVSGMNLSVPQAAAGDSSNRHAEMNKKAADIELKDGDNAVSKDKPGNSTVQIRKNFNETAFFFPDLRTDSSGVIELSFTMPEALTRWKLQTLAHTPDLAFGLSMKETITQKQLMVQPNTPRFLREGDRMEFSAKIVNLSAREITGQAQLELFDATTNQSVDGWFQNMFPNQYFTVAAGQSEAVQFPVQVPYLFNKALSWRIVARTSPAKGSNEEILSDGEEASIPVLTNKMLVTESLPINMQGNGTKDFHFDKLLQSGTSETLQHYALTVEYTSNPVWYAVQALPYLMEYPYECAEQTWNRYYANSLASMIANSNPRIRQVFEKWKTTDSSALLSNLQKNEELKSVLLQETPWVLEAKTEEQQKKNIALLFDLVRMSRELNSNFEKLQQMQGENGGFVWFKGGPDDRYITQYILAGIGHLKKLNSISGEQPEKLKQLLTRAIPYLDKKIKEDYDDLLKHKTDLKKYSPGYLTIQYLYMRSFFPEYKLQAASLKAVAYFNDRAKQTWTQQSKYMQGMIALFLSRSGDAKTPAAILKSLKETSIVQEELGMYWKNQRHGWYWYEAPIETQALLIEAFAEAGKDYKAVEGLQVWLLKNKQTNNWQTTRASADACYALLLQGANKLASEPVVTIRTGNTVLRANEGQPEAGSGYFKSVIPGEKINPAMGNIQVTINEPSEVAPGKERDQPATRRSWGNVYWQYFENLDKITPSETPLKLVKKLFIEKNTDRGPALVPVNEGDVLQVGNKIKVRIELRVDRDMEYVHLKDMRAACLEPVNVLSGFKWQGGLGYYETTQDASTHFFFGKLGKGTYIFEYGLFVTHKGNFSNGITSIQSMYAPEFSSHSEGIRVQAE